MNQQHKSTVDIKRVLCSVYSKNWIQTRGPRLNEIIVADNLIKVNIWVIKMSLNDVSSTDRYSWFLRLWSGEQVGLKGKTLHSLTNDKYLLWRSRWRIFRTNKQGAASATDKAAASVCCVQLTEAYWCEFCRGKRGHWHFAAVLTAWINQPE